MTAILFLSQMWRMKMKRDCELMLSLSVYVVLECPTTVCDFLSWSYSHVLLVKPAHMTAGRLLFLLPFDEPANHRGNGVFLIPPRSIWHMLFKTKRASVLVIVVLTLKRKKKKWFRNIVSMLVYKTYNRFNLVCSCEKEYVKNWYLTEKRKLAKKKNR